MMGRKTNVTFIESDALFITQPFDVANYFNDYFIGKVGKQTGKEETVSHRTHAYKKQY